VPIINKIDLQGAQPDEAKRQIEEIVGLDATHAILASAKEGTGATRFWKRSSTGWRPRKGIRTRRSRS
jgi:GTP-binding protein LepA